MNAPAARQCPAWCAAEHSSDKADIYHHAEIGRLDGGELTVVVEVAAWSRPDTTSPDPAVAFSWSGSAEDDNGVYLLEGIEFSLDESEELIDLLRKANETLRTGRRP